MTQRDVSLSIIVPVLNEAANIAPLLARIRDSLAPTKLAYEVIFIDDHSTDDTVRQIKSHTHLHPIVLETKRGERGKAYSLLEGFSIARGAVLCMIDADLQYPPEAIPGMVRLVTSGMADIVLSRRIKNGTGLVRRIATKGYNLVFVRMLLGLNYDTQAGLKVFKKKVVESITVQPSKWSFDLEFIVRGLIADYTIFNYDIQFDSRHSGEAKVSVASTALELARSSIKLRNEISRKRISSAYKKNNESEARLTEGWE